MNCQKFPVLPFAFFGYNIRCLATTLRPARTKIQAVILRSACGAGGRSVSIMAVVSAPDVFSFSKVSRLGFSVGPSFGPNDPVDRVDLDFRRGVVQVTRNQQILRRNLLWGIKINGELQWEMTAGEPFTSALFTYLSLQEDRNVTRYHGCCMKYSLGPHQKGAWVQVIDVDWSTSTIFFSINARCPLKFFRADLVWKVRAVPDSGPMSPAPVRCPCVGGSSDYMLLRCSMPEFFQCPPRQHQIPAQPKRQNPLPRPKRQKPLPRPKRQTQALPQQDPADCNRQPQQAPGTGTQASECNHPPPGEPWAVLLFPPPRYGSFFDHVSPTPQPDTTLALPPGVFQGTVLCFMKQLVAEAQQSAGAAVQSAGAAVQGQ